MKVSIITSCYNREKTICGAVESGRRIILTSSISSWMVLLRTSLCSDYP